MGYKKIDRFLDRVAGEASRRPLKTRALETACGIARTARVLASFGRVCHVLLDGGEEMRLPVPRALTVVTGDIVETDGRRVLDHRPRGKVLARADAQSTQIIAANIDRVVLVQSVGVPPFREGLTDRYRVFAAIMDLPLLLVLNKAERPGEDVDRIASICRDAGVESLVVSAKSGLGMKELADRLSAGASVFSGHSGVGKSSLLSALMPGVRISIGDLSKASQTGCQKTTTTRAYKFRDGYLIDTPGIRQFGFVGIEPGDVSRAFPDILQLSAECRFRNCLHDIEPGCAVKRAVEEKKIPARRYRSYHRIIASVKT